jgi:D-alanyl-D-alanine carboxypeptidase/D-alanyl-D-alanine-endopeptidase (penicillin-binding protein 4)
MRRTLGLLVTLQLLLLLVAVLPTQIAVAASGGGTFCKQLRAKLLHGGGGASGLFVVDGRSGKPLCARAARRQRPLASNTKLFTTATALSRFGPDATIATRLLADGTIDDEGVLHGSLYLQGGGDPALGTPAFYNRFLGGLGTDLYGLTRQVRAAGLTAVTGKLYADDDVFDRRRGVADSGYATSPYIGPLSGLSLNSGYSTADASSFASDPARVAASKLLGSLIASGVRIRRGIALGDADEQEAETVAVVRSPSIEALANNTDVYSNNFFAEMLLKLVGAEFGSGGTTAAGAAVVEEFAATRGTGIHAVDGSGLTRGNRASPIQVVRLLQSMRTTPVGEDFVDALALTGREGTVAQRMRGGAAEARCRVKTGTLTGVSNLSGYCFNASGREVIFSVLMGSVGSLDLAHYEQDRIAAAVAGL